MSGRELLTMIVPIIVAVISGGFAYKQARKVAERNAKVEAERIAAAAKVEAERIAAAAKVEAERVANENRLENRKGWESLNRDLVNEIDRLRDDRREDQDKYREDLHGLASELNEVRTKCLVQGDHLRSLESWARAVVDILSRPAVMAVLEAQNLHVPTMPPIDWRGL